MIAQPANINYDISALNPVFRVEDMTKHLGIHNAHIDRFNKGSGDIPFEKAACHLHKLFFENIRENRQGNRPLGKVAEILELRYGTTENFMKTYFDTVDKLQGSGWVFMNTSGYLNIIPNNRIVDNIGFIIDFWEHAYFNEYGANKKAYASDVIKLINWEEVNKRILASKEKNKEKRL